MARKQTTSTSRRATRNDACCAKCRGHLFELRLLKDEGVGAATCNACGRSYLLLDSADYWFDVIQQGYPRPARCSCKGKLFALRFDYEYRSDGDVREATVLTTCASCGQTRRAMHIEVDYTDTDRLIERPLIYCRDPKILYDLQDLSLYVTKADIARIVQYLADRAGCRLTAILREDNRWVVRRLDTADAKRAIRADNYLWLYASPGPVKVADPEITPAKAEDRFWKRADVIRLSSPTIMNWDSGTGLLYYLGFSNEYVHQGRVHAKSVKFRRTTTALVQWLQTQFVSWRSPHSFDNPGEHNRLFGDQFRKSRRSSSKK